MLKWCGKRAKSQRKKERQKGGSENISKCSTLSDGPVEQRYESTGRLTPHPCRPSLQPPHGVVCVCVCGGAVSRSGRPLHLSFPSAWALQSPQTQSHHPVRNYWRQKETRVMLCKHALARISYYERDNTANSLCFKLYEVGVHRDICFWHSCGGHRLEKKLGKL